jgi:hypothetical protein
MTIGDVLATIAVLSGLGACSWAVMMGVAMLFPGRCGSAKNLIADSFRTSFFIGALLMATLGLASVVLLSLPLPGGKLLGWLMMVLLLATAAIGAGGIAMLGSERIKAMDPGMSDFAALSRGAMITFLIGLMPILGWFFAAPVMLTLSLGTGARVVFGKAQSVQTIA